MPTQLVRYNTTDLEKRVETVIQTQQSDINLIADLWAETQRLHYCLIDIAFHNPAHPGLNEKSPTKILLSVLGITLQCLETEFWDREDVNAMKNRLQEIKMGEK